MAEIEPYKKQINDLRGKAKHDKRDTPTII